MHVIDVININVRRYWRASTRANWANHFDNMIQINIVIVQNIKYLNKLSRKHLKILILYIYRTFYQLRHSFFVFKITHYTFELGFNEVSVRRNCRIMQQCRSKQNFRIASRQPTCFCKTGGYVRNANRMGQST